MPKEIMCDGRIFIEKENQDEERTYITIVDSSGLTYIGQFALSEMIKNPFFTIKNAQCIIRWGTSQHLAELVKGPLSATKLGAKHDVIVQRDSIITCLECDEGAWE